MKPLTIAIAAIGAYLAIKVFGKSSASTSTTTPSNDPRGSTPGPIFVPDMLGPGVSVTYAKGDKFTWPAFKRGYEIDGIIDGEVQLIEYDLVNGTFVMTGNVTSMPFEKLKELVRIGQMKKV